jgi:hypothetical protein
MKREVRLVAFNNDAFALLASGFPLQIAKCRLDTKRTISLSSVSERETWELKARSISQVSSKSPEDSRFFSLEEMLKGFPIGFSPKIEKMITLYVEGDQVYALQWIRDTIHRAITVDEDYQTWTLDRIRSAWKALTEMDMDGRGPLEEPRPSLLVVESIRSLANPMVELTETKDQEAYVDLLIRILSQLYAGGEMAKLMYDLVYRVEVKRGVKEYAPYKREA